MPDAMLTDTFGRRHTYLRISLTERCNLRCRYCMPAGGVDLTPEERLLTAEEVLRLARLFVRDGVTKIRLTGGEPLVRPGSTDLIARLAEIEGLQTLAITTNGLLLSKKLPALVEAGVDPINLSLDTLRADRFQKIARREGHGLVLRAMDEALAAGREVKVNCVVMRGENDDELADFVRLTKERPLEVRFIELMPFQGNAWSKERFVSWQEMQEQIEARFPALESLDDGPHATTRTYQVPGHEGRVGFIASMTAPFCEGCNRLRLTADGHLKVCLFGKSETSLRDPMRSGASDEELTQTISRAVDGKEARHAGMDLEAARAGENRPMITIGG